jgi:hypothetical protein
MMKSGSHFSKYEMHVIWRTWSMINGFCFPANYSMSLDICAQFTVDTTLFLLPSFSPLPVLVLFRTFSSAGWAARPNAGAIFRLNFHGLFPAFPERAGVSRHAETEAEQEASFPRLETLE